MLAVIILAIVQGLTEFLPVSSDGHLVLAGYLLGQLDARYLDLVIFMHGGSLLVLIGYYHKDLWALTTRTLGSHTDTPELRRLFVAIVAATLVTGVLGILAKDTIEKLQHPGVAAAGLLFTGVELLSLNFVKPGTKREVTIPMALLIALFQTLAILPGVSRSGSTITVGLWLGLAPAAAARFSFLLAIPAIAGALLLDLDRFQHLSQSPLQLAVGFLVCAAVSLLALVLVLRYVEQGRIRWFGVYCIALGLGFLAYLGLRG